MKTNLCTAGSSYIHLYPNGDVYRCMKDYNTKKSPITNIDSIIDGRSTLFTTANPCSHRICDVYCDSDWSSKWLFEDKSIIHHESAKAWDSAVSRNPWATQSPTDEYPGYLSIVWAPTLPCNYNCQYCGCAAGYKKITRDFPSSHPERSKDDWLSFFAKILEKYPWGYLQTNGGEPFLSEATIPVINFMAEKWAVNVVTNGSVRMMELTRSNIHKYEHETAIGLSVTLSLHPTARNFSWDTFLGTALMIKNAGYLRGVNFVGWPGQLYLFDYYKETLDRLGISIWLQPWAGEDHEKFSGYLPHEEIYIKNRVDLSREEYIFELGEYRSLDEFSSKITVNKFLLAGDFLEIRMQIENTGKIRWSNDEVKLGARLFHGENSEARLIREYRSHFDNAVEPNTSQNVDLKIPVEEIISENLNLLIDLVYENKFWFVERGNTPISIEKISINIQDLNKSA